MAHTPAYKAAEAKYGDLVPHFTFYGAYHTNGTNQLIHLVGVPIILSTSFAFLRKVPVRLPAQLAARIPAALAPGTAALPIAAAYAAYYAWQSKRMPLLGAGAVSYVLGALASSAYWPALTLGGVSLSATQTALGAHVAAWIAQFVGHGVYEGRKPALLDNLFQALFEAPYFVYLEGIMLCGGLREFKAAIEPAVAAKKAELEAAEAAAKAKTK